MGADQMTMLAYSSEGRYVVALKVTDEAGNWNEDTITIFVNNLAPVADAGEDQIVYQGQVVTFDGGNSSDTPSDEPYLTYVWYFGDGFVGAGKVTTHTYTEPGVYTVTLIVTDNNGAISSDTLTVATKDATWPTANAGQDDYVDQNVPYQFDGRASTDDVGIVAYQWDIDSSDGIDWSSPDYEGAAPTHVYTEPGVYVVSLRVIDGDGNHDIDTLTITVKETPEKVKVPCAPTDVEVLLTPENDALNISWIAPTENEDGSPLTETDLDHYEIYYRIGENQKFQKLCDAPIGAISHIHSDLMTGIMYYYYLIAVDRDSTRSQPSITVGRMPSADTDGDQNPDITDEDDDNDGYPDVMEIIGGSDSKNALSKPADNDADLLPDYIDTDDDNDDHLDSEDDYPLDPTRWKKAEDGFVWLWIFIGLIIALLCIIALLGWKLYGVGEERPQEQHPKEKTPVKPKEDMKKKRVARRPPKKLKPPMAKSKPKGLAPPPPPPPSLPPPPPPPFSPLPTEEAAPQEEPKSAEESEEEVEFIIVEEQNVPEQPFTEEGITEGELPEAPTEEFEIEEKKSPSQSPKERPRKEEIPEPKIDEPETEE
jgi:PKD repeat protein